MMNQIFRLYWLRESGCDAGTRMRADELPAVIRDRVLELAAEDSGEFAVRLPFLDRKEWPRHEEILRTLPLEREDRVIRAVLAPLAAARDLAATLALTDPAWENTPTERDPAYFGVWQRVSLALQRWLRDRIAEEYFRDVTRFEDRGSAYEMIVYQASRLFYGKPRTEFTYDLRDYPECRKSVAESWKMTGNSLRMVLQQIEQRLYAADRPDIAHRYAAVWHQDIALAVQRKPKRYVDLLASESAVINAAIELGTQRSAASANRFARTVNLNLRKVHGMDMRGLGVGMLEEATRALSQEDAGSRQNFIGRGMPQNRNSAATWRPDFRIAA